MPNSSEAERLGHDAFVFGFPLLLMSGTMRGVMSGTMRGVNGSAPENGKVRPNRFAHAPNFPGPDFRAIVGAHPNTLYSVAWLDLSGGPVCLRLPNVESRCYLLPLLDAWSNLFASLGPRADEAGNGAYAIGGPDWDGQPSGKERVLRVPTHHAWAICHLHVGKDDDLETARALQRQLEIVPLNAPDSRQGEAIELEDLGQSPHHWMMEISAEQFFPELAMEMSINPPHNGDGEMLADLARIGLRPGQPFAWSALERDIRKALAAGVQAGKQAVDAPPPGREENGWRFFQHALGKTNGDYLQRARVANFALGLAHPEDALFPLTAVDADGNRLSGSNRYVLRFEPGALPPAGALWSLALYDMDQLFAPNPLKRYALGSRDDLELGPDGSLEILIQHERPDRSTNWLPAPEDDFNLMLHLYWPEPEVLAGEWIVPPVVRR